MIKSNSNRIFGNYNSDLIKYLIEHLNYDGSRIIYSDKYGDNSFTINKPNNNYINCNYINGYPHFDIPLEVCLEEIDNYINNKPIYDSNFCIRYGDVHPNKPIPMQGQVRNLIIADTLYNMINTSGEKIRVFSIGDISEKTIKYYVSNANGDNNMFEDIYHGLMRNNYINNEVISGYHEFCIQMVKKLELFLKEIDMFADDFMLESELYSNKELYDLIINEIATSDGIKQNGELNYSFQELMFILNGNFKDKVIYNVIGADQSDHIKRVLKIMQDNYISNDVRYLTYGILKNAGSRDLSEWSEKLSDEIDKKRILIGGQKIDCIDFFKFLLISQRNNNIVDLNNINRKDCRLLEISEIFSSLLKSKKYKLDKIGHSALICKMALVNSELDKAIVNGEQNQFLSYLYSIALDYNNNFDENKNYSTLYSKFMEVSLDKLSISKTKTFSKIL